MACMNLKYGKVDFSEWNFLVDSEKLTAIISEAASDAVQTTLNQDPPLLSLAFENNIGKKGQRAVNDPLTINLSLPLASDEEEPSYCISFAELAIELIEDNRPGGAESGNAIDADIKQQLHQFVDSLKELAISLEIRINSGIPCPDRK